MGKKAVITDVEASTAELCSFAAQEQFEPALSLASALISHVEKQGGQPKSNEEPFQAGNHFDSNLSRLYFIRGQCHLRTHQLSDALADLTTALKKDPHNRQALLSRSNVYIRRGLHPLAIKDCNTILDDNDEDVAALVNLGVAEHGLGQWSSAASHYQAALSIAPEHPEAIANLEAVRTRLEQHGLSMDDVPAQGSNQASQQRNNDESGATDDLSATSISSQASS